MYGPTYSYINYNWIFLKFTVSYPVLDYENLNMI